MDHQDESKMRPGSLPGTCCIAGGGPAGMLLGYYPVRARKSLCFQYDSDNKIWAKIGAIAGHAHPVQSGDFRRRRRLLVNP